MATATAPSSRKSSNDSGGFFTPYKSGQGFWTRMGTGIGAGLIILFTIQFLYRRLPIWTGFDNRSWPLFLILATVALVLAGVTWWLINKPRNADFLINTDGEMKKVNWPTRRELWGSTKVVVAFMFFMAAMLFGYDVIFGIVFWSINVLKIPPLFFGGA